MTTSTDRKAAPWHGMADDIRSRLADHIADRVGPAGSVAGACRGRVLETALAVRLADLTNPADPADQEPIILGLRGFLARASDLTPLEQAIVGIARDRNTSGRRWRAQDLLHDFDHHTAVPKKALVDVVFRLLGGQSEIPEDLTRIPDLSGLHTWKQVERIAQKVIACHALGREHLITPRDIQRLVATQQNPRIWEGNILTSLIVLFALHAAGPAHHGLVRSGLRSVLAARHADGGIPFILDWSGGATPLAAMGLAGHPRHARTTARLAEYLAAQQQPDGGWTYSPHSRQTDAEDSSYALQALHAIDPIRHGDAVRRGRRYYLELQNPDGGTPTYLAGNPSEVCMTAEALVCLAGTGTSTGTGTDWPETAGSLRRGLRYLLDNQRPDGTFELSWSRSHASAVFRSVRALGLAQRLGFTELQTAAGQAVDRAVGYVLATQNPDGGWGHGAGADSEAVSTAFSLIALTAADTPAPVATVVRGLGFLAASQKPDGDFDCVTDEVGPRPIPYDVPDSMAGFVLKGLNFALSGGRTPHYQ